MKQSTRFKQKKVVVIGLAVSGYHVALLLSKLGADVTVNDSNDLTTDEHAKTLQELGVSVIGGSHPLDLINDTVDYVVKNPGIPYHQVQIKKAVRLGIPVLTDIEIAFEVTESPIVAITGTNGKTTTTRMIERVLNQARPSGQAYAAGNIGIPATEIAQKVSKEDTLILELSSFQLMGIDTFKPNISVITNIYSAHLDYHGSQIAYEKAKLNLITNQDENDFLIYNADQPKLVEYLKHAKATHVPFSRLKKVNEGAYIEEEWLMFKGKKVMPVAALLVQGAHNLENALATVAVSKVMGQTNESIQKALETFTGVKHRLQYVESFEDRKFYNDSKATNTLATIQALKSFQEPLVLIAGGLDRHADLSALLPFLSPHVRALIVIGETSDSLISLGQQANIQTVEKATNMQEAVQLAFESSQSGDSILLSPASASWDQYKNFEERGEDFIRSVCHLIESKGGNGI